MSYHNTSSSYSTPTTSQRQAAPPGYHYMPDGSLMLDSEMQSTAQNTVQSATNDQGQTAPAGFHYMPDGTLMKDEDHEKTIRSFELDLSSLPAASSIRPFSIKGDDGATFSLEIKNEDNYYYNFITNLFQATKAGLNNKTVTNGLFKGNIIFPTVTDDDKYDISLSAQPITTRHADYFEVRFGDGSVDINSTKGSNSLLLTKVIYQYINNTLTLAPFAAQGAIEAGSLVTDTVSIAEGGEALKQAFSISCAVTTASKCYRIIKQPTRNDVAAFIALSIGSAPVKIPGENIYPAVTATGKINVAVDNSTTVTVDGLSATPKVGDLFSITNGTNLSDPNLQVVTAVGEGNVTSATAVTVANDKDISFSNQMNYKWPITNQAHVIKPGMKIITNTTNLTADTTVADYLDTTTLWAGTEEEEVLVNVSLPAIDTLGLKPVITRGEITTQAGTVIFDKQQKLALASDALRVGGYGQREINRLYGWEVVFSDLKIELTPVTTTTTSAVSNSTSVPVTERGGILDDVSTVSGIGINASVVAPTVDTGAGAVTGAGTLVLTAAQTLESGATLTFAGAGTIATITGNIEILKAGSHSAELDFDIEKLLSIT